MNQDGTANGPSNPAAPGSIVTVWGTGFGTLDPSCATGAPNPDAAVNLAAGFGVLMMWDGQQQALFRQERDPQRAQVHVDEEFHAVGRRPVRRISFSTKD